MKLTEKQLGQIRTQIKRVKEFGNPFYTKRFANVNPEDIKTQEDFENFTETSLGISETFAELSTQFFQQFPWKSPTKLNEEARVYQEQSKNYPGSQRWRYRCRMYHKPQSWELENGLRNMYYEMWKK